MPNISLHILKPDSDAESCRTQYVNFLQPQLFGDSQLTPSTSRRIVLGMTSGVGSSDGTVDTSYKICLDNLVAECRENTALLPPQEVAVSDWFVTLFQGTLFLSSRTKVLNESADRVANCVMDSCTSYISTFLTSEGTRC